jgi:hypothetical protein
LTARPLAQHFVKTSDLEEKGERVWRRERLHDGELVVAISCADVVDFSEARFEILEDILELRIASERLGASIHRVSSPPLSPPTAIGAGACDWPRL